MKRKTYTNADYLARIQKNRRRNEPVPQKEESPDDIINSTQYNMAGKERKKQLRAEAYSKKLGKWLK